MKQLILFLSFLTTVSFSLNSQCETKLVANNSNTGMLFGQFSAVDGNRVAVGAWKYGTNDTGAAYIKEWNGSAWVETFFQSNDISSDDRYGYSIDIFGDRMIVGAPYDDDNGSNSGSAYVYDWDGSSWTETKLTASDGAFDDRFGRSVSVHNDRIIVGAFGDDDNGLWSGSAYIFDWDGSNWNETKLTASDGDSNDVFAQTVHVHGDRVVMGAKNDEVNGMESGSIYIFEWDGSNWNETKILASDGAANDQYGRRVGIYGDRVVSGSWRDDDNGLSSGSVYIYDWNGSNWVESKLLASDGDFNDQFGEAVGLHGDRLVVGATGDEPNGLGSGSAYLFEWDGSTWVETKVVSADNGINHNYGVSCDASADYFVVGATIAVSSPGAVYVYEESFDCYCPTGSVTNTFLGFSDCWLDPINWSSGSEPTRCDNVLIPAGMFVTFNAGETGICYTLDVHPTARITVPLTAVLEVVAP